MNDTQLTPQGIAATSFADKAKEYSDTLAKKTKTETEIEGLELEIRELLNKHDIKVGYSDRDLLGLDEKLKIYKPVIETVQEGLVYTASRVEGRAFSEIVNNPPLFKKLVKKFGGQFEKFFKEVDDVFHQKEIKTEAELDVEKTNELSGKYHELVVQLVKLKTTLKTEESTLKDIEKYIAFCKELGTLAGKPQGKDGGGQQAKQQ